VSGRATVSVSAAARILRWPFRALRELRYWLDLYHDRAAGELVLVDRGGAAPGPLRVEVRLSAERVDREEAVAWCGGQTLPGLAAVGFDRHAREVWRVGGPPAGAPPPWFAAPGRLPEVEPAFLESAALVAAAEAVDAVVLAARAGVGVVPAPAEASAALGVRLRQLALYSSAAYTWDPGTDLVRPLRERVLVKLVAPGGVGQEPRTVETFNRTRRGAYLARTMLPARLEVPLRDPSALRVDHPQGTRPTVLVLTSFLARGGAEHTLYETLRVLRDRFDLAIVTLAPHLPERGDRRADFERLVPRLYCLGDVVHPLAMPGLLELLVTSLGVDVVYNANGTTLFYELGPRLKARHPELRVVDHLYDHRVGYVDRYRDPALLTWVDACVAENSRIAEHLVGERGWPAGRVPVVYPCGRHQGDFPDRAQWPAVRDRMRRELGVEADDVLILTAARMHPQKRPLDLVELARRTADLERVTFLVVGGGELEGAVDAAIAGGGGRVRRLPFRTDIPDLVVAADVGCLVSDYEGLPVFLLECLQAGRPFLGTDVGDLGRVLAATGAGLVVRRPGDLDGLEAAVRRLADPAVRAELAARALAAAGAFTVEACAERYAEAWLGSGELGDASPGGAR